MAWDEVKLTVIRAENGFVVLDGGRDQMSGARPNAAWVATDIKDLATAIVTMFVAKQMGVTAPSNLDEILAGLDE